MGKLFVTEGLDGSGKATQTALLAQELGRRGVRLKQVSFPDYAEPSSGAVKMYLGGEFGSRPGDVNAYAASSFYAVDRCASYLKHWRADYADGALILADRYTTSNMIYQLPKLPRGEWAGFLRWLEDFEYGRLGLPRPDLTVFLDMPPEVSQKLLDGRYRQNGGSKDLHERNVAFLLQCREAALFAADALGWRVISCASGGNPRPVEEISAKLLGFVLPALREETP